MGPVTISLAGIRASGWHGASPGEREEPQEFVVDLEVEVTVDDDDLGSTVDYRVLAAAARDTVERRSFLLLESLAHAVARAAFEFERVERVTATVHKPRAAGSLGAEDVSVSAVAG